MNGQHSPQILTSKEKATTTSYTITSSNSCFSTYTTQLFFIVQFSTLHVTVSHLVNQQFLHIFSLCVQTAYGEEGLSYTFSGNTVPAQPWIPSLICIRDLITSVTGFHFNFVLVNRQAVYSIMNCAAVQLFLVVLWLTCELCTVVCLGHQVSCLQQCILVDRQ